MKLIRSLEAETSPIMTTIKIVWEFLPEESGFARRVVSEEISYRNIDEKTAALFNALCGSMRLAEPFANNYDVAAGK